MESPNRVSSHFWAIRVHRVIFEVFSRKFYTSKMHIMSQILLTYLKIDTLSSISWPW